MFRFYLATALMSFGLYNYAQYRGWSVMPSEAQEFQTARSSGSSSSGGRSGGGGGSSGHK
jgi:hypothetical protein